MANPQQLDPKDIELWANTKLSSPWSGVGILSQLDTPKLNVIIQVFSKGKLDQLVKVRLLLACLLLPQARKDELAEVLSKLAAVAQADEDEFVRATAHSCGGFSGQLDLAAVMAGNPMVRACLHGLHACMVHMVHMVHMHADMEPTCMLCAGLSRCMTYGAWPDTVVSVLRGLCGRERASLFPYPSCQVEETVGSIWSQLDEAQPPAGFMPMQVPPADRSAFDAIVCGGPAGL